MLGGWGLHRSWADAEIWATAAVAAGPFNLISRGKGGGGDAVEVGRFER